MGVQRPNDIELMTFSTRGIVPTEQLSPHSPESAED